MKQTTTEKTAHRALTAPVTALAKAMEPARATGSAIVIKATQEKIAERVPLVSMKRSRTTHIFSAHNATSPAKTTARAPEPRTARNVKPAGL